MNSNEDAPERKPLDAEERQRVVETMILGSPQRNAVPVDEVLGFDIVRDVPVKALAMRLRASARRLQTAMYKWADDPRQNLNGRVWGEMLRRCEGKDDGFAEKRILIDERVVACWNELCSRMTHLRIRDFGGLPFTMFGEHLGGEAHIDISRGDVESDDSAEALVERMMLKHASNQLWLCWHALYSEEDLYFSKKECIKRWNNMNPFEAEPKESEMSVRAGYAASGVPVFEFVTETWYGSDAGIFRWRAMRDESTPFGVKRAIIQNFPKSQEYSFVMWL